MSELDLFVEMFPIAPDAVPPLTAYRLDRLPDAPRRLGNRVAARLRKAYPGIWLWMEERIITDQPRNEIELNITLDIMKDEHPERYDAALGIETDADWRPSPQTVADVIVRTRLRDLDADMRETLKKSETSLRNVRVEREHHINTHVVNGQAVVSLSIASRLIYFQDVQTFVGGERSIKALNDTLSGLRVSDKTSSLRGEIISVAGTLAQHRDDLLMSVRSAEMERLILDADDTDWVITVRAGGDSHDILARALALIVRVPELARFDVDQTAAIRTLQLPPRTRAGIVASISDIAKNAGVLQNAFNSRTHPDRFFSADFEMNVRFGTKSGSRGARSSVIAYNGDTLPDDFTRRGAYHIHEDMFDNPLRVCVVNTLSLKLEDFVEALQRYLSRNFAFGIDVVRERKVRVVSRANLESAVRVVEKEDPDIILAFFPDDTGDGDDDDTDEDATATYIQSLTLGRALPTLVIYESTLNDPDAMAQIVLSILGKTGNAPFVLAEPIEHTDFIVGLALVRDYRKSTGETRLTIIARVYKADGEFVRYGVREMTFADEAPPYVLMRDLFPQREFSGKRIVIHHDGPLPADLKQALTVWGQAIQAMFYPVEIMRFGAPRLYGIGDKGICQPAWGSAFKLGDDEALLVSSVPETDITPQPLHIRTISAGHGALNIESALRGVLVGTLLAYNAGRLPKLPVTIINADQMAYWLKKGNNFNAQQGIVPFWL